jgi:hypothetical protein
MRRREVLSLLGGAGVSWPLAVRAQQQAMPVIGFLHPGSLAMNSHIVAAFRQGLAEAGYVEMWRSNFAGRIINWANYRRSRLISSACGRR